MIPGYSHRVFWKDKIHNLEQKAVIVPESGNTKQFKLAQDIDVTLFNGRAQLGQLVSESSS